MCCTGDATAVAFANTCPMLVPHALLAMFLIILIPTWSSSCSVVTAISSPGGVQVSYSARDVVKNTCLAMIRARGDVHGSWPLSLLSLLLLC